jgi:hypothetical protein
MCPGLICDAIVEIIGSESGWIDGITRGRVEVDAKDGGTFGGESETDCGT